MADRELKSITFPGLTHRYVIPLDSLKNTLKAGTEATAEYHLGFYLDENGDLCQVEEDENNG